VGHNLHPLWQGKGAFLNLPHLTSASGYKHYKCHITMLQCRIWGKGAGIAGEWRHSHKGHRGKRQICCSITAANFSPVFALRVAGLNTGYYKM